MSQYTNELIGDASTHQKNQQNQHKFYKSSMDLLGLLLWFQHRSDGCYASTSWLANKLSVSDEVFMIYKLRSEIKKDGFIGTASDDDIPLQMGRIIGLRHSNKRFLPCLRYNMHDGVRCMIVTRKIQTRDQLPQ